jgi:Domain of unknown function (DUF1902)
MAKVRTEYDDRAKVWYVAESDVPGLNLEASDLGTLEADIRTAIPALVGAHIGDKIWIL